MTGTLAQFLAVIRSQVDVTPYLWGGDTLNVGLDCSGLIYAACQSVGVTIPRDTWQQWAAAQDHTDNMIVALPTALAPGDLIYFSVPSDGGVSPQHVGVYVGTGQMIDAPHSGLFVEQVVIPNVPGIIVPFGYARITGFAPPAPPAPKPPPAKKEEPMAPTITFDADGNAHFIGVSPQGHPLHFEAAKAAAGYDNWSVVDVTDEIAKAHPGIGPYTIQP